MREQSPGLVDPPVWEPVKLRAGERIERFIGDYGARIDAGGGDRQVVDSTLPLRSDLGDGQKRLADLSLKDAGAAFEPANPLLRTVLPKRVDRPITLGGDGMSIGLQTPAGSSAAQQNGRLVYANALPDTDLVVMPTPSGVELSFQVRSQSAPGQATFDLGLPKGISARLVATGAGKLPPSAVPGSVQLIKDGEDVGAIRPPVGRDADGTPVKTWLSLTGGQVTVNYDHRSADLRYPLVIDPYVDRYRVDANGNPITTGSFVIGSGSEAGAWNFNYGGVGAGAFYNLPAQNGTTYDYNNALSIATWANGYYPNDAFGQWYFQAPRSSNVWRADYVNLNFAATGDPYPYAMCAREGLYSFTKAGGAGWETGPRALVVGPGQSVIGARTTPWIGGPAPEGSCTSQTNNSQSHWVRSDFGPPGSPSNYVTYGMFAYGTATRPRSSTSSLYGASVFLDDSQPAYATSATTTVTAPGPGGWVRSATVSSRVQARDAAPGAADWQGGLGTWVTQLRVPSTSGQQAINRFNSCDRGRVSRCPLTNDLTFSYSTDDANPDLAGNQPMPEGVNAIDAAPYDILAKGTTTSAGSVKVDRSGPVGDITGVADGELLRGRDYTISAGATDGLSGAKGVTIKLDGATKATRSDCPQSISRCAVSFTLAGGDPALTEGTHQLEVTATDQVNNDAAAVRKTFRVDRTAPTLSTDGSLKPTKYGWVGSGIQDLALDASDPAGAVPATGATYAEVRIDGNLVDLPVERVCDAGGCDLSADFTTDTTNLSPGAHTLTALVRDGAGNETSETSTIKVERDAPSLTLGGSLKAAEGQTLEAGATYALTVAAGDGAGPGAQSGLGRVSMAVDNDRPPANVESECPLSSCPLTNTFTFNTDDYEPGPHTITVTATDQAGNETSQQFTVGNPQPPEPSCGPAPMPTVVSSAGSTLSSALALDLFRQQLPQAFAPWQSASFGGGVLQPALGLVDGVLQTSQSLNDVSIDRLAADGVTLTTRSDTAPICLTPSSVSDGASDPTDVVGGSTVLFANALPATDLAIRATVTGAETFAQLRDPSAPTAITWNVNLQPGQELRNLPDGGVAVVNPVDGGEPNPPDPNLASAPTVGEQQAALTDPILQVDQATNALERALEGTGDDIVAVMPKPWATDAAGRVIATSLSAAGSQITMQIQHTGAQTAYPVVADPQVVMADSLDEYEAQQADSATADYTDAEADSFQPPATTTDPPPTPPAPDPNYQPPADMTEDGSAQSPDDFSNVDQSGAIAEADAAAASPALPRVALTESHPALFYSPDRLPLAPTAYRPAVPWRVVEMVNAKAAKDRARAKLWTDWYSITKPGSTLGAKTQSETQRGIKSDIAVQFADTDKRPPKMVEYRKNITAFLNAYGNVVGNVSAWNEPQLNDTSPPNPKQNPTRNNPFAAARYWLVAQRLCHPAGAPARCGQVVAGEYAGASSDQRYKLTYTDSSGRRRQRTGNYQTDYRDYLLSSIARANKGVPQRAKTHYPHVWGFHAYADANRYELVPNATKAPVMEHYVRDFRGGAYRNARIWLTAVGAYYRRPCGELRPSDRGDYCKKSPDGVLVIGTKRQRNAVASLLRRISFKLAPRGGAKGIEAFYYYALHNTASAATYGGPSTFAGRGPRSNDWGLIGTDDDAGYTSKTNVNVIPGEIGLSQPNAPRLAYCTLRAREVRPRPSTCAR